MHILFSIVLVWGILHSILASKWVKQGLQRWLGPSLMQYYRLFYNIISVVSFLPILIVFSIMLDKMIYKVPLPWSPLMVIVQFIAIFILIDTIRQTGIVEFLGIDPLRLQLISYKVGGFGNQHKLSLIKTGWYSFVRHPAYSAGIVILWFFPIMTQKILGLQLGLTLYLFIGAYLEERKLEEVFKQEYADYIKDTPMFVPIKLGKQR